MIQAIGSVMLSAWASRTAASVAASPFSRRHLPISVRALRSAQPLAVRSFTPSSNTAFTGSGAAAPEASASGSESESGSESDSEGVSETVRVRWRKRFTRSLDRSQWSIQTWCELSNVNASPSPIDTLEIFRLRTMTLSA